MREIKVASYAEAERFLNETPMLTRKNPFDDTKKFYAFLQGEADSESIGKVIHVAGTNGKGSVCAFLQRILAEAGYHTGMFTSPHLVTTRERFEIDGEMISEEEFVSAFNWLSERIDAYKAGCGDYVPSYFERLFFMGVHIFAQNNVDITILETGLGGRLDTTNVVESPALCVITEIGLDHMEYLGDTLPKIAAEKAGIIKPNVPVVFLEQKSEISDVLRHNASQKCAKTYIVSENEYKINEISKKSIDFSVFSSYDVNSAFENLRVNMPAAYQAQNAALAVRACEALNNECGMRISRRAVRDGIESMRWSCRMEEIIPNVYIDGAHNEDGIETFAASLENTEGLESCILLFSAVRDKRYDKMIERLCGLEKVSEFAVTHITGERGEQPQRLAECFDRYTDKSVSVFENVEDAVSYCVGRQKQTGGSVYVVGSLYLAGRVKRLLEECHDRF